MTHDMQMRLTAFVRTIADECDGCHYHGDGCRNCAATQAKVLLRDVELDEVHPKIDYSFYGRVKSIKCILEAAGRPLLAKEIDLKQTCSPQLKCWTLNQMVYKKILERKPAFTAGSPQGKKTYFFYYLKNKETK